MKTLQLAMIMTLSLSIIFLIASQHAFAGTCSDRLTSYNAPQFYLLSDGVFAGTVQHIDNATNHQWKVYFTVDKLWRGSISQKPLMVMTNSLQGCGYSIVQGEKYLVYTNGYPPFFNTVWSKPYADAQSDIAIIDDPKFQSGEKTKEELDKKLVIAKDAISNLMGSKMGDIPFNSVGVDVINSTLDIGIDSAKAVLSEEAYEKKIRDIVGDIPIKITFGQIVTDAPIGDTLAAKNSVSLPLSPLKQFKMGTFAQGVHCNTGLQLFFKAEDYTPACAQSGTATVLLKRGWATTHPPEHFVSKFAINGLQQNYTIGQPINATVNYAGYYWYAESEVKILDANGTQIWFNCPYCYVRSAPVPHPSLDAFTYIVRDYSTNKLPVINKTGTYTMIASLENKTASAEFTIVKPLTPLASFEPCDTPFQQSNRGIAVLYMPVNSTGKLCVDYSNQNPSRSVGVRIFEARHLSEDTKDIQVLSSQDNIPQGDSTIVYAIKTSKVGFYGLTLFCYGTPLAVGYDNQSRIVVNDFPWLGQTFECPMQSYTFHISGISGMGVKYIPYP